MPSSDKRLVRRLCTDAMLLGVALMLSYVEAILPLGALIPLPGFRLGLAQTVVTLTFFLVGKSDAAMVSGVRVLVMGLLFGNAGSVWFSVCGAALAYLGLWLGHLLLRRRCSYIGLGVLCAALHNAGQCLAAAAMFGSGVLLSYLPVLLIASVIFGAIGGLLLNLLVPRLSRRSGGAHS